MSEYSSSQVDFTEWISEDPENKYLISPKKVSWNHVDRTIASKVYKDYTKNLFEDFEHSFTVQLNEIDNKRPANRHMITLWKLWDKAGDVLSVYAAQVKDSNDKWKILFFQRQSGKNLWVYVGHYNYDINKKYFFTIKRKSENCQIIVCEDDERENRLEDSGFKVGVADYYRFLSVANGVNLNIDREDWSSGSIENLQITRARMREINEKYKILLENESTYLTKIKNWKFLKVLFIRSSIIFYFLMFICVFSNISIQFTIFIMITMVLSFLISGFSSTKISKIKENYGLKEDDIMFLETYRTFINLDNYLNSHAKDDYSQADRHKNASMDNMKKVNELVNDWDYGNLNIIKKSVGNQIDSLKENLRNKTFGHITEGTPTKISILIDSIIEFLIYFINPSIEQIYETNKKFRALSDVEFTTPSKFESAKFYLYNRPNLIRFVSALFVSASFYFIGIYWAKSTLILLYPTTGAIFMATFLGIDRILSLDKKHRKLE